jgi:hypothetical protein
VRVNAVAPGHTRTDTVVGTILFGTRGRARLPVQALGGDVVPAAGAFAADVELLPLAGTGRRASCCSPRHAEPTSGDTAVSLVRASLRQHRLGIMLHGEDLKVLFPNSGPDGGRPGGLLPAGHSYPPLPAPASPEWADLREPVTTAMRHGSGPVTVYLILDRTIICEVADSSNTQLRLPPGGHRRGRQRPDHRRPNTPTRWKCPYSHQGKTIWTEQPLEYLRPAPQQCALWCSGGVSNKRRIC